MPLPREHLLDELATAYVQTVIAAAGATLTVSRRDYGVDGIVKDIKAGGTDGYFETGFPIEFQLKGTASGRKTPLRSGSRFQKKIVSLQARSEVCWTGRKRGSYDDRRRTEP